MDPKKNKDVATSSKTLILLICTILSFKGLLPLYVFPHDIITGQITAEELNVNVFFFITFLLVWMCYFFVGLRWIFGLQTSIWVRVIGLALTLLLGFLFMIIGLLFVLPAVILYVYMCFYEPSKKAREPKN